MCEVVPTIGEEGQFITSIDTPEVVWPERCAPPAISLPGATLSSRRLFLNLEQGVHD